MRRQYHRASRPFAFKWKVPAVPNLGSSARSVLRMKFPACPDCGTCMRLESVSPDLRYRNLQHIIFTCGCGRTTDQLVADKQ
jgi:hypothetical protein